MERLKAKKRAFPLSSYLINGLCNEASVSHRIAHKSPPLIPAACFFFFFILCELLGIILPRAVGDSNCWNLFYSEKFLKMIAFFVWSSEYIIYSHGLQLKMYKLLYSGNPPCSPVPQLPNLPPHGPPVLLDSCVALQIYFMLMQGNKLYVCFTSFSFFFLVAAFTMTMNVSKMLMASTKKLLLVGLWVNWGSAGSSWTWLDLSRVCHTFL